MSFIRGVHFVGASGVGKTTLAGYVAKKYGFVQLPSASRAVLRRLGVTTDEQLDQLRRDATAYLRFQIDVATEQARMEGECTVAFVSDRAFDNLAYFGIYGTGLRELRSAAWMGEYLRKLTVDRIIFHVDPSRKCWEAAVKEKQRTAFLVWEDMLRVDGALRYIAQVEGIRCIPIATDDPVERWRIVDGALAAAGVHPREF